MLPIKFSVIWNLFRRFKEFQRWIKSGWVKYGEAERGLHAMQTSQRSHVLLISFKELSLLRMRPTRRILCNDAFRVSPLDKIPIGSSIIQVPESLVCLPDRSILGKFNTGMQDPFYIHLYACPLFSLPGRVLFATHFPVAHKSFTPRIRWCPYSFKWKWI